MLEVVGGEKKFTGTYPLLPGKVNGSYVVMTPSSTFVSQVKFSMHRIGKKYAWISILTRYAGIMHRSMQGVRGQVQVPYAPSPLISQSCQWSPTVQETILRRKYFGGMVGGTYPLLPGKVNGSHVVLPPFHFSTLQVNFSMHRIGKKYAWFPFLTSTRIRYAGITHRSMQGVRGQVWVPYAPSPVISQSCQWYLPVQDSILRRWYFGGMVVGTHPPSSRGRGMRKTRGQVLVNMWSGTGEKIFPSHFTTHSSHYFTTYLPLLYWCSRGTGKKICFHHYPPLDTLVQAFSSDHPIYASWPRDLRIEWLYLRIKVGGRIELTLINPKYPSDTGKMGPHC